MTDGLAIVLLLIVIIWKLNDIFPDPKPPKPPKPPITDVKSILDALK